MLVGAAAAHVDGDGAGGDGGRHVPGDPSECSRGEHGKALHLHGFGITHAPGHGGALLVAGVEQAARREMD